MAKLSGSYTIPDDHVALIGRIAESWSQLEFHIDQGIWNLADTEQQLAACITSQLMSIHPRLKAFTALIEIRGGSEQSVSALKKFAGNITGLTEKRNRSVHDPRFKDRATNEIHRLEITAKPKVHFGFVPETQNDLKRTVDQIHQQVSEFIDLRNSVINEIGTLPTESLPILQHIIYRPGIQTDQSIDGQEPPSQP